MTFSSSVPFLSEIVPPAIQCNTQSTSSSDQSGSPLNSKISKNKEINLKPQQALLTWSARENWIQNSLCWAKLLIHTIGPGLLLLAYQPSVPTCCLTKYVLFQRPIKWLFPFSRIPFCSRIIHVHHQLTLLPWLRRHLLKNLSDEQFDFLHDNKVTSQHPSLIHRHLHQRQQFLFFRVVGDHSISRLRMSIVSKRQPILKWSM